MCEEFEEVDLPDTQTQECVEETFPSQEPLIKPWGLLSALMPTLQSVDLYNTDYKVGRDRNVCNIVIEDLPHLLNVSKTHFEISKENDIVYIKDLSKNGTFVNSTKVGRHKKSIIHSNDIISLGLQSAKDYVFISKIYDNLDLPSELSKKYFVSKLLGQGAVGEVRLCLDKRTCVKYATKRIYKSRSVEEERLNHPQKIRTEIEILRKLSHPFIIHMQDVFETDREVFLILEYMKGGVLTNRILSATPLPEIEVKYIFYQMLLAVQYLHENGVTHRDLKPANVLLESDGTYPMIKISDFGLSKIKEEVSYMETICGTLQFAAPEILSRQKKYNNKVDVWSLGVILFYMLCKELPFQAGNQYDLVNIIIKGTVEWNDSRWGKTSYTAKDVVKRMLTVAPVKRIDIERILKHPWIAQDKETQCRVNQLCSDDSAGDIFDISDEVEQAPPPKRLRYN